MNGFSANNLLLSLPVKGCIWLFILFALSFFGAHVIKLAREGWQARRSPPKDEPNDKTDDKTDANTKKEAPNPGTSQQPIYYIVEKKRRRPKQDYGEPKPIKFQ